MKYLPKKKKKKIFNNLWRFCCSGRLSKQSGCSDQWRNKILPSWKSFFFSRKTETFNSLIHWIQTECLTLIATFTFNIIASISPTASTSLSLPLSPYPSLPRCGMNNFKSGWLPRPRWVTPRRVSTSAQSGWCRGDLGKPQ